MLQSSGNIGRKFTYTWSNVGILHVYYGYWWSRTCILFATLLIWHLNYCLFLCCFVLFWCSLLFLSLLIYTHAIVLNTSVLKKSNIIALLLSSYIFQWSCRNVKKHTHTHKHIEQLYACDVHEAPGMVAINSRVLSLAHLPSCLLNDQSPS